MRSLDETFLDDLKDGRLKALTNQVRSDTSLCLEFRGKSINVYYRGGSLMRVDQRPGGYAVSFNPGYFGKGSANTGIEPRIVTDEDARKWIDAFPKLKQTMDRYFSRNRKDEREFQQLLVRENNFGRVARSTDYYICDVEYRPSIPRFRDSQFDAVAVHWPSEPSTRKMTHNRRLVFVEIKYGDDALSGDAGLEKHIRDVNAYLSHPRDYVKELKEDMTNVFNQKRDLRLIDCGRDLDGFSRDELPILLLVLANHDPGKKGLRSVLEALPESPHADLRIATASFLGYGLYDQGVHTVEDAFRRFGDYIYKDLSPKA